MIAPLRVLDLFSGIGGFSLGLERACHPDGAPGFVTTGFCEINPYARRVLARHWPDVPIYDDVRAVGSASLPGPVDVVCGGFPCQDISLAGAGAGLGGERSGLWFEMLRIITETRPAYVIAENVAALRSRGLATCLRGLAAIGYDAEWHCIPAAAVGAPHRRDRVWIVAYPNADQRRPLDSLRGRMARQHAIPPGKEIAGRSCAGGQELALLADADSPRRDFRPWHDAEGARLAELEDCGAWRAEPGMGRVADGVPSRVDRLRCLGNAVVPQIPELIGRAIIAHHNAVILSPLRQFTPNPLVTH